MAAGIIAIIAGLCLLGIVVYPMGKAPLRENEKRGWSEWKKEFSYSLKFYSPAVILNENEMGWDHLSETLVRLLFGLAGLCIIFAGFAMISLGVYLLAIA